MYVYIYIYILCKSLLIQKSMCSPVDGSQSSQRWEPPLLQEWGWCLASEGQAAAVFAFLIWFPKEELQQVHRRKGY